MKAATRDGFGKGLVELGKKNKNVVAICADLKGSVRMNWFEEHFPKRYVEVGVAEQNLVTVASGMAHMGKIPFASSFAVFCPGRCWEQIRTTIGYNNQNVKIVGSHAGLTTGEDGATHQAIEDIATMRSIPGMTVIMPCDFFEAKKATIALGKHVGPAYLRIVRDKTETMTTSNTPFKIGKAITLRNGKDIAIIGCGPILIEAMKAADELKKKKINARVINIHTIKPIDKTAIIRAAKECKRIITIEDHNVLGGLGSAVSEVVSEACPVKVVRLGMQDKYGESGKPDQLFKKYGMDSSKIVKEALKLMGRK